MRREDSSTREEEQKMKMKLIEMLDELEDSEVEKIAEDLNRFVPRISLLKMLIELQF